MWLQIIPGVNKIGSVCILSEIGTDMSKFPTVQHLASWAGICPGNNENAGRQKSTRVTQGNQYLKPMLSECSWCATNIKECYLRRKYESLIGRPWKKRALVAVAQSTHRCLLHSKR